MKTATYYDVDDIRWEERPRPEIKQGEVLVKVKVCGLCGTDIGKIVNKTVSPGTVLGHEAVGEIVALGEGVKKFKEGDRVFFAHHVPCFNCHYCRHSNYTLCPQFKTTNIDPGGFSEYVRVPYLNVEKTMFCLPKNLSYEEASLIEPLATVLKSVNKCNVLPGDTVVIVGLGPIGILHLLLFKNLKAGKLVGLDIQKERLKIAGKFGADMVINSQEEDFLKIIKNLTGKRGADFVIVTAGNVQAIETALSIVREGGKIILFAGCSPETFLRIDPNLIYHSEVVLEGSYSSTPLEQKMVLELLMGGKIKIKEFITHRFPLKNLSEAVKLAREGKNCLKIIITP